MEENYYQILGINKNASLQEIKKAYHRMAIKYHPDKNKNGSDTKFKLIAKAYETLSDPEKKRIYDFGGYSDVNIQNPNINPFDIFDNFFATFATGFNVDAFIFSPELNKSVKFSHIFTPNGGFNNNFKFNQEINNSNNIHKNYNNTQSQSKNNPQDKNNNQQDKNNNQQNKNHDKQNNSQNNKQDNNHQDKVETRVKKKNKLYNINANLHDIFNGIKKKITVEEGDFEIDLNKDQIIFEKNNTNIIFNIYNKCHPDFIRIDEKNLIYMVEIDFYKIYDDFELHIEHMDGNTKNIKIKKNMLLNTNLLKVQGLGINGGFLILYFKFIFPKNKDELIKTLFFKKCCQKENLSVVKNENKSDEETENKTDEETENEFEEEYFLKKSIDKKEQKHEEETEQETEQEYSEETEQEDEEQTEQEDEEDNDNIKYIAEQCDISLVVFDIFGS